LDTETGKTLAALDIIGDTDDLFYDPQTRTTSWAMSPPPPVLVLPSLCPKQGRFM
jgi:hypothetical protein